MAADHNISFIAHYTAQVWVRERLPWAWRFDTRAGRLFYSTVEPLCRMAAGLGYPTPHVWLAQRHRIIDALVARLEPAQLVELAGGLSPRGLALSHKRGVPCIDADLEPMVQLKAALLGGDQPAGYRLTALDLLQSEDYAAVLQPALRLTAPTVVIAEGILSYFTVEQQRQVFERVAALLRRCGGGTFLAEVHHQDEVGPTAEVFRAILAVVARSPRHPMIANLEAGRALVLEAGFAELTAHRPREWQTELGLTLSARDVGLHVYQATVPPGHAA